MVDSGFLGWAPLPTAVRLALHLPLAVAALALVLAGLTVMGLRTGWWARSTGLGYAALALAALALAGLLAVWHLIGWGLT